MMSFLRPVALTAVANSLSCSGVRSACQRRISFDCPTGGKVMENSGQRLIVVTGVTGLQGGAVTRHLLKEGWRVRGLTRNPESKKAETLAAAGVEVVQGGVGHPASRRPAFEGAYGVY